MAIKNDRNIPQHRSFVSQGGQAGFIDDPKKSEEVRQAVTDVLQSLGEQRLNDAGINPKQIQRISLWVNRDETQELQVVTPDGITSFRLPVQSGKKHREVQVSSDDEKHNEVSAREAEEEARTKKRVQQEKTELAESDPQNEPFEPDSFPIQQTVPPPQNPSEATHLLQTILIQAQEMAKREEHLQQIIEGQQHQIEKLGQQLSAAQEQNGKEISSLRDTVMSLQQEKEKTSEEFALATLNSTQNLEDLCHAQRESATNSARKMEELENLINNISQNTANTLLLFGNRIRSAEGTISLMTQQTKELEHTINNASWNTLCTLLRFDDRIRSAEETVSLMAQREERLEQIIEAQQRQTKELENLINNISQDAETALFRFNDRMTSAEETVSLLRGEIATQNQLLLNTVAIMCLFSLFAGAFFISQRGANGRIANAIGEINTGLEEIRNAQPAQREEIAEAHPPIIHLPPHLPPLNPRIYNSLFSSAAPIFRFGSFPNFAPHPQQSRQLILWNQQNQLPSFWMTPFAIMMLQALRLRRR